MVVTKKKEDQQVQPVQNTTQSQPVQTVQNDTVQQAQTMLQQQMGGSGRYQSQWAPQINDMVNQILNRDKFSYDMNADALYTQLRDQYTLLGQQAMMDTIGQATALTGGYGNSYAQGVGQQAYQGYLQQLGDRMPDLYKMALNQYLNEGDQMQQGLATMMQQESMDYDRYRDQLADQEDAYNKLVALMENYHYEPTAEELAAAGMPEAHKNAIMKPYYDALADSMAQTGGGPGGELPTAYDTGNLSATGIMVLQKQLGLKPTGTWDEATAAAAQSQWGASSPSEAYQVYTGGQDKNQDGYKDGFSGSTYNEAVSYMTKNGVSGAEAKNAMTQSEWQTAKASNQNSGAGGAAVQNYDSYKDYLKDYVKFQTSYR